MPDAQQPEAQPADAQQPEAQKPQAQPIDASAQLDPAILKERLEQAKKEQADTLAVAKRMKDGLNKTVEQIDKAFRSTMLMYQVSFYLGVALVVVAAITGLFFKEKLLPTVFGSMGTLDVLIFFLKNPQEKLQASRADLTQLQAALYNWYMDSVNQRTLLGVILANSPINVELFEQVSTILNNNTEKTLDLIQKYCESKDGG